ncbi:MAG TPA: cupin domain-containing protein [Bryobacteraceae bacterium]
MRDWSLSGILAPRSEESFLGETLGKTPLCVPGEADRFAGLVSWKLVNELVSYSRATPPRLRLITPEGAAPASSFCREGVGGFPRVLTGEVNSLLAKGATLSVDSLDELHEPVRRLCQGVEDRLGVAVQANLYAAITEAPAGKARWNAHETIALQATGTVNWVVHAPTARFPTMRDNPPEPAGDPAVRETLGPGSALYIPRGWWYAAGRANEPSLYLMLGFRNPTGLDIAVRLIEQFHALEFMRMDYPRFAKPEIQSKYLERIQAEITKACTEPGLILGFLKDLWALDEPRTELCLPWGATQRRSLTDDHILVVSRRFTSLDTVVHLEREDAVEVIHEGRKLTFGEEIAPILECLYKRQPLTVGALAEGLRGAIAREDLTPALSELIERGLVAVREPLDTAEGK